MSQGWTNRQTNKVTSNKKINFVLHVDFGKDLQDYFNANLLYRYPLLLAKIDGVGNFTFQNAVNYGILKK